MSYLEPNGDNYEMSVVSMNIFYKTLQIKLKVKLKAKRLNKMDKKRRNGKRNLL